MLRVDEMMVNWGASPFEKRRAMIEVRRGLVGRGPGRRPVLEPAQAPWK